MTPAFRHITVPVDGSTTSERGIAFAIELVRDGGRLSFCSVVDPTLVCTPAAFGVAVDPGPMLDVLDDDAAIFCERARSEAARMSVEADVAVLHGPCIAEIESFSEHNGSDAIAIGTHGRSGVSRAMLGSVAEGIIQRAPVPVVAVHEDDELRTGPIAVALDDSPAARAALDVAIRVAAARAIPLALIHIAGGTEDGVTMPALDAATRLARDRGVTTQLVVDHGATAERLLQAADNRDCCMIVIGTHGRAPLARLVLGSVAAAVLERARIPVVTVRCAA